MRVDKYLKTARILKRREAAKELADQGRVKVNGKTAKPSTEIKENDEICLQFGNRILTVRVCQLRKQVSRKEAGLLFEVVHEEKVYEDN